MTENELEWAYAFWYRHFPCPEIDKAVEPFLGAPAQAPWLKMARNASFLSAAHVAKKLNLSRSAYSALEKSEERRTIAIRHLSAPAEAMNCELVYAIRPKAKLPFSKVIWSQLLSKATAHGRLQKCDPRRKAGALAAAAEILMNDPMFRRRHEWSQR